ncbi:probable E3 ubiquitin-protein ligase makorin-1 isoform X1 [Antechinus flavipes]|uniref:probable E3 ubiquitin-protein ligase makorin-1 isoform X1 n=1 Tax=Antechinus flavipes TaxID=38775 RepID=UPI002235819A|nr:probable E3 ubiquitin-protein ligase makorin-1 isoform X1 [Antechinus flavipes]
MADSGGRSSGSGRSGSNDSPCAWGRQSLTVCRYFQQGFCFRGNDCRYQHSQAPGSSECTTEPPLPLPEVRAELMPATLHSVPEEFSPPCAQDGGRSGMKHLGTKEEVNSTFSDPLDIPLGDLNLNSNLEAGTQPDPSPDSFPEQNVSTSPGTQTPELMEMTQDVVCGICMEKIWDKPPPDNYFAILPNCSHAYCVKCLRTWRQSRGDYPKDIIKACPECRVHSNFFVPYKFWVSKGPEKEQLIKNFKDRTSQIQCKFFIQRKGRCPFKSDCIYQHQFPNSWTKNWDSILTPSEPSNNTDEEEIYFLDHTISISITMKKTFSKSSDSDDS